jgi:hypothetical protein
MAAVALATRLGGRRFSSEFPRRATAFDGMRGVSVSALSLALWIVAAQTKSSVQGFPGARVNSLATFSNVATPTAIAKRSALSDAVRFTGG